MSGGTSVFTVIPPHLDSFQVSTAGSGGPSLNARVTAAGLLADLPLQRQWRFASLRDGLRPPLTPEPLQADWAQAIRGQGTPCPVATAGYLGGSHDISQDAHQRRAVHRGSPQMLGLTKARSRLPTTPTSA